MTKRPSTIRFVGLAGIVAATLVACSKPRPVASAVEVVVVAAVSGEVTDWDEFMGHFAAVQSVVSLDSIYVYFDSDELPFLRYIATSGMRDSVRARTVEVGLVSETGF